MLLINNLFRTSPGRIIEFNFFQGSSVLAKPVETFKEVRPILKSPYTNSINCNLLSDALCKQRHDLVCHISSL